MLVVICPPTRDEITRIHRVLDHARHRRTHGERSALIAAQVDDQGIRLVRDNLLERVFDEADRVLAHHRVHAQNRNIVDETQIFGLGANIHRIEIGTHLRSGIVARHQIDM